MTNDADRGQDLLEYRVGQLEASHKILADGQSRMATTLAEIVSELRIGRRLRTAGYAFAVVATPVLLKYLPNAHHH